MKLIGNFILPFPHFSPKMVSRFFLFQSQTKNENCLWNYRSLLLGGLLNVKSMICGLTECCPSIWIPPNQIPSVRNPIIFQKNWLTKKITLKINPFPLLWIPSEGINPLRNESLQIILEFLIWRDSLKGINL